MTNTELIKEILSETLIKEKYNVSESDIENINGDARYQKDIVKVLISIIDDHSNHITERVAYNKIKNILNL